jgi:uncharacterized membrane protein SirB2
LVPNNDLSGRQAMLVIKHLHVFLAYVTVIGFAIRGILALMESPLRQQRWLKIAPHVIDTLLLACGIALAVQLSISPLVHGWLMAKIIGLLAYIGFGVMAMRASSRPLKIVGFAAALLVVAYMFRVAYTKQVWPF